MASWDDLRFALAVAREGSLARAARVLAVDHTTVGRRVEALEADLGVRLFTRTTTGYVLTREAEELLPELQRVEEAVMSVERRVEGKDARLRGLVRVTTGEVFSSRFLTPRLGPLRAAHPELCIEIVTSERVFDLSRREADIALRFLRSSQDRLVVRKVAELAYGVFTSPSYLARHGTPKAGGDFRGHAVVSVDTSSPSVPAEDEWFAQITAGAHVAIRTNSTANMIAAAQAGLGLALLPCYAADRTDPPLVRVPLPDEPTRSLWLTVHKDLQQAARVRAVMDGLIAILDAHGAVLRGKAARAASTRDKAPLRRPRR